MIEAVQRVSVIRELPRPVEELFATGPLRRRIAAALGRFAARGATPAG